MNFTDDIEDHNHDADFADFGSVAMASVNPEFFADTNNVPPNAPVNPTFDADFGSSGMGFEVNFDDPAVNPAVLFSFPEPTNDDFFNKDNNAFSSGGASMDDLFSSNDDHNRGTH